jgi:urease accessory protein
MLDVFRSLPVARAVYAADGLPDASRGYARDTIGLGWEARMKARGRRRSDGGVEFGTALPRGTVLRDGDLLVVEEDRLIVMVIALDEPVFVIEPVSPADWGLFAYQIGNSHQPLMLTDREIVCPDVPGMEQVLGYHRIPFTRATRRFTPVTQVATHQHQL